MNKQLVLIPGLLALGIATGVAMLRSFDDGKPSEALTSQSQNGYAATEHSDHPMAGVFTVSNSSEGQRIQKLEQQIAFLVERVEQLEQDLGSAQQNLQRERGALVNDNASPEETPVSSSSPALSTENLIKAGIAETTAADIIRRKNEIDLQLLELRDQAIREGYLGSSRYASEYRALQQQDVSLREEVGDSAYDRYLYASGQANRVKIDSVMMGSPAEEAGIRAGDVILNYDDTQMFDWSELREATTRGERGDYVNVTVLREGQRLNLWLPRGPLGVRLGALRLEP